MGFPSLLILLPIEVHVSLLKRRFELFSLLLALVAATLPVALSFFVAVGQSLQDDPNPPAAMVFLALVALSPYIAARMLRHPRPVRAALTSWGVFLSVFAVGAPLALLTDPRLGGAIFCAALTGAVFVLLPRDPDGRWLHLSVCWRWS
jgi:peptidoglycan/LPS O-acetylase OafA/YrhL